MFSKLSQRTAPRAVNRLLAGSHCRAITSISKKNALLSTLNDQLKVTQLHDITPAKLEQLKGILDGGDEQYITESVNALDLDVEEIFYNSAPGVLYQEAIENEAGTVIVSSGALAVRSGKKTGRSPLDKRVVEEPSSKDHVWWGKVNVPLGEKSFLTNRERAVDYLNVQKKLYIVDGYAGYGARWGKKYQLPIRIITTRAYHALFMQNMLVMPTKEELARDFGPNAPRKPFVVYNAGCFPCNRQTEGMTSSTSVSVHFAREEMVILGTQYAGEMKKGVFTLMNYYMPLTPSPDLPPGRRNCPLHASANIGKDNDVSIFFGLSGTGKTTLSADPKRELIGDDEHVWTDEGVFNIEGGCYAKTVGLTREKEPEVYDAIRFGSVLENVVYDDSSRVVDFDDTSITENGRVAYDLSFIPNARIPAIVDHQPKNIILLTCDAFGVLPPVSRLTPEQVMYHFISGYTAKVAGTEMGVVEPQATFSPCFGGPFLVHHPFVYAEILAARIAQTPDTCAYLVNTGWVGGGYGVGNRCSLKYTRALIDAIHDGTLANMSDSDFETMPIFGLQVPNKSINGVPLDILHPSKAWAASGKSQADFDAGAKHLAQLFSENFKEYASKCSPDVIAAGPSA